MGLLGCIIEAYSFHDCIVGSGYGYQPVSTSELSHPWHYHGYLSWNFPLREVPEREHHLEYARVEHKYAREAYYIYRKKYILSPFDKKRNKERMHFWEESIQFWKNRALADATY